MKIEPLPPRDWEGCCPWCDEFIEEQTWSLGSPLESFDCPYCKKPVVQVVDLEAGEVALAPMRSETDLRYMVAMGIEEPTP